MIDEATLAPALEEARALVQIDGGDMQIVSVTDAAVNLRLVIEGASCAECVMPRPFLEQLVLDMLQRQIPAVSSVNIEDPREAPGWVAPPH